MHIASYHQVMNASYGDIDRSSISKSPATGINDSLNYLALKAGFPAGLAAHLQRTQKDGVKGNTPAKLTQPYGQPQFSKHRGRLLEILPITPFACLLPSAQSITCFILPKVLPQFPSGFARVNPLLAQLLRDQAIVASQYLRQNPNHYVVSDFSKPVDNLVQRYVANCKFELKCYRDFTFHYGFFLLALGLETSTIEKDHDFFYYETM
jgi:hypothetical protein